MKPIRTALLVLAALGAAVPAFAQSAPSSAAPPATAGPPRQPPLMFDSWNRGPPQQPGRPYVQPGPQVAPPMERVTPVAPLSPRLGN